MPPPLAPVPLAGCTVVDREQPVVTCESPVAEYYAAAGSGAASERAVAWVYSVEDNVDQEAESIRADGGAELVAFANQTYCLS